MIRVLELRSVRGTGGGPEKTILLGAARTDPRRFKVTVCYIRDARDTVFAIDERAASLGVDYVELTEQHSFDPGIWRALRDLVRRRAIDVVHAHEYKTDLLAWLLSRTENVIPLATVHGWTGHSRRERWVYYPADRMILARYPRLISVSGEITHTLVASGTRPENVTTILNGIDHTVFQRQPENVDGARAALQCSPGDYVVGAVGRLEPQKRFDLLIDAIADLHSRHPAIRLMIAGDGSLRQELEAQAARVLPAGVVRFLGHFDDVTRLHHALDLFVQSSDYEGTSNAVLEAMALETPIVATDAGGTAEMVADGVEALVIQRGSAARIAAAIDRVLADPAAARARAAAARRRVETDLSFATRTRRLEEIYEELVQARPELQRKAS